MGSGLAIDDGAATDFQDAENALIKNAHDVAEQDAFGAERPKSAAAGQDDALKVENEDLMAELRALEAAQADLF